MVEYRLISKKGEGTFSEVLKAQSTKTNKYVAIKCMKAHFYNIDQVTSHNQKANPNLIMIGEQLARDLGTEALVAASEHHNVTRSALVRQPFSHP